MGERRTEGISSGWNGLSTSKVADEFSGVVVALGDKMERTAAFGGSVFFQIGLKSISGLLVGSKINFNGS